MAIYKTKTEAQRAVKDFMKRDRKRYPINMKGLKQRKPKIVKVSGGYKLEVPLW